MNFANLYNYWECMRDRMWISYYYYFPPKAKEMIFVMFEEQERGINFITDDMGNSVFLE